MRKSILFFILLAMTCSMCAQEMLSNSEVNSQWRTKTISVKNGGQQPDVVTLLRAFNQSLPTWVASRVLNQADHPAQHTRQSGTASIFESEDDYRILIDRRNGYVDLESETDIEQMAACVWRKDNGHRIFAVSLYEQHDPVTNLLCWYDYDPKTQTMKPEKSPLDDFKPGVASADIAWDLPMKGTDFIIREYYPGLPAITHVYRWNKKQFNFARTDIADFEYRLAPASKASERISMGGYAWSHYTLLDLTENGNPIFALCNFSNGEIGDMMFIGDFKGEHVSLGMKTQDGEKLNVFHLPDNNNGDKQVAVVHRDMAGGKWYNVMLGNLVQFQVCDLPNFASGGDNVVEKTAGYGAPDETVDIINELGEWIDISKYWHWNLINILEGEEEAP